MKKTELSRWKKAFNKKFDKGFHFGIDFVKSVIRESDCLFLFQQENIIEHIEEEIENLR